MFAPSMAGTDSTSVISPRIYEANENDRGGAAVHKKAKRRAERNATDTIACGTRHDHAKMSAGRIAQPGRHDAHTDNEEGQASQNRKQQEKDFDNRLLEPISRL